MSDLSLIKFELWVWYLAEFTLYLAISHNFYNTRFIKMRFGTSICEEESIGIFLDFCRLQFFERIESKCSKNNNLKHKYARTSLKSIFTKKIR